RDSSEDAEQSRVGPPVGDPPADVVAEREVEQRGSDLHRPDGLRRAEERGHQARAGDLQPQRDNPADEDEDQQRQALGIERRPPGGRLRARRAGYWRGGGVPTRRIGPVRSVGLGREVGFVGTHAWAAPWDGVDEWTATVWSA